MEAITRVSSDVFNVQWPIVICVIIHEMLFCEKKIVIVQTFIVQRCNFLWKQILSWPPTGYPVVCERIAFLRERMGTLIGFVTPNINLVWARNSTYSDATILLEFYNTHDWQQSPRE